jgi:chemotaxis signal transduction protein
VTSDACVCFEVEGRCFVAPVAWALEAVPVGTVTPLPTAPPEVIGVTQVRGQILPLLDLPRMLGGRPATVRLGDVALRVSVGDTDALLSGATALRAGEAPAGAVRIDLPELLGRLRGRIGERVR